MVVGANPDNRVAVRICDGDAGTVEPAALPGGGGGGGDVAEPP